MKRLYASPLRVYLCLGALALAGILSGLKLPVSLFPNSSKPVIGVRIPYGSGTPQEFLTSYGNYLEEQLHAISTDSIEVDKTRAHYDPDGVTYEIEFKWGTPPKSALKEVETVVNSFSARFTEEVRRGIGTWTQNDNSGFLAVSFYSPTRSLDELYDLIEPLIVPQAAKVRDAQDPGLWNPSKKEIRVELNAERMAALQLFPADVDHAVSAALESQAGGAITVGAQQLTIQMPRSVSRIEDLNAIPVPTPGGRMVHLSDVAKVDFGLQTTNSKSFKTSGAPSLILFADPRPGGNVKRMSEEILEIVREAMPKLPKDVQYKVLVDPSEFIRASIHNVFREVAIGALLAVAVLFLFIGSFRNTVTAAIEIPLSMVLAFILMRLSGMNLNLISLGGLALSAGMNVDGSVVVMENIFRHFEEAQGPMDFERRLRIIGEAVAEVRFSVIASTIASVVVFLPLAFTSDLSYAVLGDLAKTVVFSHGFSAVVALILVPTVRLQLMSREARSSSHQPPKSPIEGSIRKLEDLYGRALGRFVSRPRLQWATYAGLLAALALLVGLVLPRLPKEIIGTPDTDWMFISVNTKGNTLLKQMESQMDEMEARLLARFGTRVQYTFTQARGPNRATIMARLKDKGEMRAFWKDLEAEFTNTPFTRYFVGPWNPAELPIPDPPQLRIAVRGGELEQRRRVAQELDTLLEENQVLPRLWTDPDAGRSETITLRPNTELWPGIKAAGATFMPWDLADLARVATTGRRIGTMTIANHETDIFLRYPDNMLGTAEDLGALPVAVGSKLVPLKALSRVGIEEVAPTIYREDGRELFAVLGKKKEGDDAASTAGALKRAEELVEKWKKDKAPAPSAGPQPSVVFEDAEVDLHEALHELGTAVGLSVLLIFFTLIVQFGSLVNAALVLVAVPLGFIGVLLSLFAFRSTLSLNSALGVILLNGIAVANSIILVDFLKRLVDQGLSPAEAAVEAGRKRLRPILITSMTTILGMMPIALGLGEGGRILQPLGIAVSGGLWVSMGLTLFVVPALQVRYLDWRLRRSGAAAAAAVESAAQGFEVGLTVRKNAAAEAVPESQS